jgi:flagellar biosynthesis GTPase FlhF
LTSDRYNFMYEVENANWVKAYDPTNEPRPKTPMNHPAAIMAERMIVQLSKSMERKVQDHPYDGPDKHELVAVIKKWQMVAYERVEQVLAAIGTAGTGKSTSLNLLINAELSRTVSQLTTRNT